MSKQRVVDSQVVIRNEAFAGPIPPPAAFSAYEQALPGTADRILKMAEAEQAGRIEQTRRQADATSRAKMLGPVFGFLSAIVLVAGAVLCARSGASIASGAFAGATLAAVVRAFVRQG